MIWFALRHANLTKLFELDSDARSLVFDIAELRCSVLDNHDLLLSTYETKCSKKRWWSRPSITFVKHSKLECKKYYCSKHELSLHLVSSKHQIKGMRSVRTSKQWYGRTEENFHRCVHLDSVDDMDKADDVVSRKCIFIHS